MNKPIIPCRNTPEHNSWHMMIKRCKDKNRKNYGGKGISVCERWLSFKNFLEDMGTRPIGTTLDRMNNDLGYYKENCRWATRVQQNNNTSKNVTLSIDGVTKTVSEWSREPGARSRSTIYGRLSRGWDAKKAVFDPPTRN